MKYKKLSDSQIIISIDRLTRFKPPEEKYLRVFKDIIISNLIEPKYKKNILDTMDYSTLRDIAVEIFNNSINAPFDKSVNEYLEKYENTIFNNSIETKKLLNNTLNFSGALTHATETLPKNLKWLKSIVEKENDIEYRIKNKTLFPIEKIVIAEGITEEILLPVFANLYGYNFDSNGVKIIGAGGKNQVVKLYYKLYKEINLPIFILLDKDAESNEELINNKLRSKDKIHLLGCGEFEDLLPKQLIVNTINNEFKNFINTNVDELFQENNTTVKILEEFFKEKCLHEFKKAEFAQRVKQQINSFDDISEEVKNIITEIKSLK